MENETMTYDQYRQEPFNLSLWGWKKQHYEQELFTMLESFEKDKDDEIL